MAGLDNDGRRHANAGTPGEPSMNELTLEREKVQIERERLALERERWSAEREKYRENQKLTNRAAGRLTLGISTFTLSLLCAILTGGALGAWLVARHQQQNDQVAASLLQALGGTNELSEAEASSPLLRALGRPGRAGGYLLILN